MQGRRDRGRVGARLTAAGLFAALSLATTGCSLFFRQYVSVRWDYLLEDPADKRSDRDRFVEWRGKKKPGFQGVPFGIAVAPVYLRPPFTLDGTIGIFDPSDLTASANTSGCIELDEEGFFGDLGHYFLLCLDYILTPSPDVRVRTNVDANTMFYPSVYGGVARLQADLNNLSFQFRPLGASSFDTITTTPIADPTIQWFPSMGALGLLKGGVMNFDSIQWTNTAPSSPTLNEQIAWYFEEAMRFLNQACGALDGFDPDPVQAGSDIQASFSYILSARSDIDLLPDLKLGRQALKKLDCVDKNAGKALEEVADGDVEGAIGKINKGLRCGADGLIRLRDFRVDF